MKVSSTAFQEGAKIPQDYTGDGKNVSPPLSWSDVPAGTQSFAVICDDPDAPVGTWVHWVIFNIAADRDGLPEAVPTDQTVLGAALSFPARDGPAEGTNDFKKLGYGGPAPPRGKPHRYFFKVYALDTKLDLKAGASKKQLEDAMKGHVLGQGQLMGKYER